MIERLKREHRSFESKLDEANNNTNRDNNIEGIKIIHDMSESVIHHAVKEVRKLTPLNQLEVLNFFNLSRLKKRNY
jgi:hypothetical protein